MRLRAYRFYPSFLRLVLFYAALGALAPFFPGSSIGMAMLCALVLEILLVCIWERPERKWLVAGLVLAVAVVLFLLRESESFFTVLSAVVLYPLTHAVYDRRQEGFCETEDVLAKEGAKFSLKALPVLLFAGMLGYRFFTGQVEKLSFFAVLFLLLIEVGRIFYGRMSLRLTGYWAVFLLALYLLPMSEKPIDWSAVARFFASVGEKIETMAMDISYYTAGGGKDGTETGYNGLGTIGGGLKEKKEPQLYLSDGNSSGRIYLKGAQFLTFEGDKWTNRAEEDMGENPWPKEFLKALYRQGVTEEEAACFSELKSTQITYGYLRTKDIMHPLGVLEADPGAQGWPEVLKKGDRYRVQYVNVDFGSPYLQEILRKAPEGKTTDVSDEELASYGEALYHKPIPLSSKEEEIGAAYLNKKGITDPIQTLSEEITAQDHTDYDKVLSVESYLRGFSYGTDVDTKGDMEAFLFEEKTGYCSHFATATVLLLRAQGIPARYCEGYLCRLSDKDKERGYVISGGDAHAWAEAYIKGFGWLIVESTPCYPVASDYSWHRSLEKDRTSFQRPETAAPVGAESGSKDENHPAKDVGSTLKNLLEILGVLAAFMLLAVIFYRLVLYRNYWRLSPAEKTVYEFRKLRKMYVDMHKADPNSLQMADALKGVYLDLEEAEDLKDVPATIILPSEEELLQLWYAVRFGDKKEVSPEEIARITGLRKAFMKGRIHRWLKGTKRGMEKGNRSRRR